MLYAPPPPALLKPAALHAKAPATYGVEFTTTKGTFVVTVHRSWAPRGADRFYNLVRAGFYTGDEFFRVVDGFVVQFGISGYPAVSRAWQNATIADDGRRIGVIIPRCPRCSTCGGTRRTARQKLTSRVLRSG